MRNVALNSTRLQTLLSNITDLCYQDPIKKFTFQCRPLIDKMITKYHPCSPEYLYEAFKKPIEEFGYPRGALGFGMTKENPHASVEMAVEPLRAKLKRVGNFLGTPMSALVMGYPDKGYIGWHHNGNAPGYNVLLTYSQDGDGHFSYWDYSSKSIVKLQDVPGWQCRVGYYPRQDKERDRLFWHMAETAKQRVTIAWVLNHKEMWKNMIEEISEGEYDPEILNQ